MLGEHGKAFTQAQAADQGASCLALLSDTLNPLPDFLPYSDTYHCTTAVEPVSPTD